MKLARLGKNTSKAEVQNISSHGIWLWVNDKEYYLPYEDFPWFKKASVAEICTVFLEHDTHIYWPELDVDLDVDSLENLEQYPLIAKQV